MISCYKRILVTGGAGFIGSCLVQELLKQSSDTKIVILDNFVNGSLTFIPDSSQIILKEIDLTNQKAIASIIKETSPELIFHLGAVHFIPYCNANPVKTTQINIIGTQNLLDACLSYAPKKLIIASTAAVYAINEKANSEDQQVEPIDIYGMTKWINERQLESYSRQVKTYCSVARFFNVFGPNETNPHVIPEIVEQVAKGINEIKVGNIKPKRDYIYVTDVVDALFAIIEKSQHSFRIYNVGTGVEYSVEEIVQYLAKISKHKLKMIIDSSRVRKTDRMHLLCDASRIHNELGWQPQYNFESGLQNLWQTIKNRQSV